MKRGRPKKESDIAIKTKKSVFSKKQAAKLKEVILQTIITKVLS